MKTSLPHPILIAEIGAAHGIRGELRVKPHTADPEAIGDYGPLTSEDGRQFIVKSVRPNKNVIVCTFDGIRDRNAAEALTGTKLYVDRSALPETEDEEEFYHADLIGLAVETVGGEAIGTVVALHDFGAGDLLEVSRPRGGSFYAPFTRDFVPTIDMAAGKILIDPPEDFFKAEKPPEEEDGEDGR